MSSIKQVIVMRKDLNMRKGKMIAQGAHASLKAILNCGKFDNSESNVYTILCPNEVRIWMETNYKKICVGVDSLEELLELYKFTEDNYPLVPKSLIQDLGLTEFNEPTYTCFAIGPAPSEIIDQITGHLKLL
jgi:PTH2 family peptidyl-tRNA hydrolase